MLEGIEALIALERTGTISEAAAQLRLTQSAVSKRLQALQDEVSFKLIEPDGRRVKLTLQGLEFIMRAKPLIAELKSLKQLNINPGVQKFSIALSDSIAATWGPKIIKQASRKIKNLEFDLHVHRSTLVEENVKMGKYDLGLCITSRHLSSLNSLVVTSIATEPLVFVYQKFDFEYLNSSSKIITIEKNSGTWKLLEDKILKNSKIKNPEFIFVESFAAISQMVKEGFGHGIIPLGMAIHNNLPKKSYSFFQPSIAREISLISRKNIYLNPLIQEFSQSLTELTTTLF